MAKRKQKVLVTGGAGFIGSHLTDALIEDGFWVFVVDDLSTGEEGFVNKKAKFVKTDINSKEFANILSEVRPDIVFHLAAQSSLPKSLKNPTRDLKVNFLSVAHLLKKAKDSGVQKIIFASSAAVYGEVQSFPIKEDAPKNSTSPYGLSKLSSEYYIRHFYESYRLPYTIMRYSNVYGERQNSSAEGGVVGIFINKILKKKPIHIYGDGKQTRDFIHVSDVVSATKSALKSDIIGEFNVGTGKRTSIDELFDIMAEISGARVVKEYKPERAVEVKHNSLSYRKINRETGWKPRVGLKDGLYLTFEYFKSRKR